MAIEGWGATGSSTANAAQTVTKAAPGYGRHYVQSFEVAITGASAGADITAILKDGTTALWTLVIGSGSPTGFTIEKDFGAAPLACSSLTAVNVAVIAGGASVVSVANVHGYTGT